MKKEKSIIKGFPGIWRFKSRNSIRTKGVTIGTKVSPIIPGRFRSRTKGPVCTGIKRFPFGKKVSSVTKFRSRNNKVGNKGPIRSPSSGRKGVLFRKKLSLIAPRRFGGRNNRVSSIKGPIRSGTKRVPSGTKVSSIRRFGSGTKKVGSKGPIRSPLSGRKGVLFGKKVSGGRKTTVGTKGHARTSTKGFPSGKKVSSVAPGRFGSHTTKIGSKGPIRSSTSGSNRFPFGKKK